MVERCDCLYKEYESQDSPRNTLPTNPRKMEYRIAVCQILLILPDTEIKEHLQVLEELKYPRGMEYEEDMAHTN